MWNDEGIWAAQDNAKGDDNRLGTKYDWKENMFDW